MESVTQLHNRNDDAEVKLVIASSPLGSKISAKEK